MTILNLQVSASADDANETAAGAVSITAVGSVSDSVDEWHGFRWDGVTIAPGSTIDSATLQLCINSAINDEPKHTFYGNDVDDAAAFTTTANDISSRALTTATMTWDNTNLNVISDDTFVTAPSVATIIQEIIDRGGWASGNAIAIVDRQTAPTDSARDLGVSFYDDNASFGAKLDIDYTAGGGGGGALPWLYRSFTQTLGAGFGGGAHV